LRPTKPTIEGERLEEVHSQQVQAVLLAVARLPLTLRDRHGQAFGAEAVFEGAVKGAAVQLIAAGDATVLEVAAMLDSMASAFRESGDAPAVN
jgi:hypothetical protein